ncbi:MAG: hypothetical protein WCV84_01245 [Patescibacteria group bacterium]
MDNATILALKTREVFLFVKQGLTNLINHESMGVFLCKRITFTAEEEEASMTEQTTSTSRPPAPQKPITAITVELTLDAVGAKIVRDLQRVLMIEDVDGLIRRGLVICTAISTAIHEEGLQVAFDNGGEVLDLLDESTITAEAIMRSVGSHVRDSHWISISEQEHRNLLNAAKAWGLTTVRQMLWLALIMLEIVASKVEDGCDLVEIDHHCTMVVDLSNILPRIFPRDRARPS